MLFNKLIMKFLLPFVIITLCLYSNSNSNFNINSLLLKANTTVSTNSFPNNSPVSQQPQQPILGTNCKFSCEPNGICNTDNQCLCKDGFVGDSCDIKICNCNTRGKCINGKCSCNLGWEGEECQTRKVQNGTIENDTVRCNPGWKGDNCEIKICDNDCNNNGLCEGRYMQMLSRLDRSFMSA